MAQSWCSIHRDYHDHLSSTLPKLMMTLKRSLGTGSEPRIPLPLGQCSGCFGNEVGITGSILHNGGSQTLTHSRSSLGEVPGRKALPWH